MEIKLINEINPAYTPIEQVLTNRGIEIEDVAFFVDTPESVIEDYDKLDNIETAAKIFLSHYEQKHKILIQVDCDVDGYTSAALLYNFLKDNFLGVNIDYQVHDDKTHGLEITQEILDKQYELIFVPDAGSNQYEEHALLKQLGIDVIILDHHECEEESKDVIIVNNQLSKSYKNKALSGVGVVWQFCRCLDKISPYTKLHEPNDYLDLVSLGLIADMMDMRSLETKKLIELGLDKMQTSSDANNAFLSSLIKKQSYSLGSTLTPIGLAFYIAPLINAIVRVGTHEERLITFEAFLVDVGNKEIPSTKRGHKGEIETVIEQATRTVTNVKNRQKKRRDEAFALFERKIDEEYLKNNSVIFINTNKTLDSNLNGLVANQIMSKYKRPTLILAPYQDADKNIFSGSARGFESSVLSDFRQFILDSGFANYAEGHANAFGVSFDKENLEKFLEYANQNLNYENCSYSEYEVDFIFEQDELTPETILAIGSLSKYWGKGIEEAYIAIKNVKITTGSKTLMSADRNPTLKILVNSIPCIKFRCKQDEFNALAPNEYTSTIVDLVGKCNLNEWMGNITPQILIEEYEFKQNIMDF